MLLNNKYEYDPKTDLIGSGGFGKVFKAKDILLERVVALKMVTITDLSSKYNLIEEIKKTISLRHSNLVDYYDAFVIKGTSHTGEEIETQVGVMEYFPAGDLKKIVWSQLSHHQRTSIIEGILQGLSYLHENSIIHRDIKPSNILIYKSGDEIIPKISDFGISKIKSKDDSSILVTDIVGAIPYMAPEQLSKNEKSDYNVDLWAFGILLYHLFIGELPFGDEKSTSISEILKNINEIPVPEKFREIEQPYQEIIQQCLIKDRKKRIQSANDLLEIFTGKTEIEPPVQLAQPVIESEILVLPKELSQDETIIKKEEQDESLRNKPSEKPKQNYRWVWTIGTLVLFGIIISVIIKISGPSAKEVEERRIADSIRRSDSIAMVKAEQQRVADSRRMARAEQHHDTNTGKIVQEQLGIKAIRSFFNGQYAITQQLCKKGVRLSDDRELIDFFVTMNKVLNEQTNGLKKIKDFNLELMDFDIYENYNTKKFEGVSKGTLNVNECAYLHFKLWIKSFWIENKYKFGFIEKRYFLTPKGAFSYDKKLLDVVRYADEDALYSIPVFNKICNLERGTYLIIIVIEDKFSNEFIFKNTSFIVY